MVLGTAYSIHSTHQLTEDLFMHVAVCPVNHSVDAHRTKKNLLEHAMHLGVGSNMDRRTRIRVVQFHTCVVRIFGSKGGTYPDHGTHNELCSKSRFIPATWSPFARQGSYACVQMAPIDIRSCKRTYFFSKDICNPNSTMTKT